MDEPKHAVRRLKADARNGRDVWLVHPPGEDPFVLRRQRASLPLRLRFALGWTPAHRACRASQRLQQADIACSVPRGTPSLQKEPSGDRLIVSRWSYTTGRDLWQILCDGDDAVRLAALAAQIGDLVARLARAGIMHRDLKLSNIVLDESASRLTIIDPDGATACADRTEAVVRMIDRIAVQPANNDRPVSRQLAFIVVRAALRALDRHEHRAAMKRLRARRQR